MVDRYLRIKLALILLTVSEKTRFTEGRTDDAPAHRDSSSTVQ